MILRASRFDFTTSLVPGVEHQYSHRRRVYKGFEVGLGPPFFAISSGVCNGHRRLRGEHLEGLFIVRRELPPIFLTGKVDVASDTVAAADLRSKKGLDGRVVLGNADGLRVA